MSAGYDELVMMSSQKSFTVPVAMTVKTHL